MDNSTKRPKDFTKDELSQFIASTVEDAIVQRDPTVKRHQVLTAGQMAGRIAAEFLFLSVKRQKSLASLRTNLDPLVAEFVAGLSGDEIAPSDSRDIENDGPNRGGDPSLKAVEDWAGPVAGPTFLERHYDISRSTLHRWQRRGEVIAFRAGGRKHVFPLFQFIDGRPAAGLPEIIALMPHPRIAWIWLRQANPETGNVAPVELLKLDRVEDVLAAARKYAASLKQD